MIFYLTFNDAPSGVYSSQVIDVVNYLNSKSRGSVKLVAFISLRTYVAHRKIIRQQLKDAIVVPMFPSIKNWRLNRFVLYALCAYYKPVAIIGRSIFATNLAFFVKEKKLTKTICYDGRGAIASEWKEYHLASPGSFADSIAMLERNAIHNSDLSIAVSNQLIAYWKREYGYAHQKHLVIPCTLNTAGFNSSSYLSDSIRLKQSLSYQPDDIILIYSGSSAGWQSFATLGSLIERWMKLNGRIKILFLAKHEKNIGRLMELFPHRVNCLWVDPSLIQRYLMIGDYGLLVREQSVTNEVSSPVKFAEYLSSGLPVIISQHLGDYTTFVHEHNCGIVLNADGGIDSGLLRTIGWEEKEINKKLASLHFRKDSPVNSIKFEQLLQKLIKPEEKNEIQSNSK